MKLRAGASPRLRNPIARPSILADYRRSSIAPFLLKLHLRFPRSRVPQRQQRCRALQMTTFQGIVPLRFSLLSRLTKMQSYLIGDTIRVYVGPKRKRYTVHKALLTQHEYFSEKIYHSAAKTSSRSCIDLLEEDPRVFELLISWLYRKTVKAISTDDEEIAKKEVGVYICLYFKACIWDMHELQNALMDRIRARPTCELGYFPPRLIKLIYDVIKIFCGDTKPLCPLRSYIVDSFIYKGMKWNEGNGPTDPHDGDCILTRKRALKAQMDAGNHEFVLDCYEALFQLCAKSKIRDPDRKTGCLYHKHKEGERCLR